MEKEKQDLINQIISDLYQTEKINNKMRKISLELLANDFNLMNMAGDRISKNEYYLCTNSKGEQGIIHVLCADKYNSFDKDISKIKVLFPFEQRTFSFYTKAKNMDFIILTQNKNTNKYGLVSLAAGKGKVLLDEIYDDINGLQNGYIVKINEKIGRVNPDSKQYDIPIKYDYLENINDAQYDTSNGKVKQQLSNSANAIVKKNNLCGAYCYIEDSHYRIDKSFYQKYIKKRFVPPLFDNIEFFFEDNGYKKIYLKVFLNGKQGILDVYDSTFVAPIVFDEITDWKMYEDNNYNRCPIFCGYIDGDYYQYDGKMFLKEDNSILTSEPYQKVKKRIENYN